MPYTPTRCDILFFKIGGQPRDLMSDSFLTLYADDDSDDHNPGVQVRTSAKMSVLVVGVLLEFHRAPCPTLRFAAFVSPLTGFVHSAPADLPRRMVSDPSARKCDRQLART